MSHIPFIYPFIQWWTYGLFLFVATTNNALNSHVLLLAWTYVPISLALHTFQWKSCVIGKPLCHLLRNCHAVFQSSSDVLHDHQRCVSVLTSSHPHQHVLFCLFHHKHLRRCKVAFIVVWLYFSDGEWCQAAFLGLISHLSIFFGKRPIQSLCTFILKLGYLTFGYWVVKVVYIL